MARKLFITLWALLAFVPPGTVATAAEPCGRGVADHSDAYRLCDPLDSRFYVAASVDFTGALDISMCTKLVGPDRKELRSSLFAQEQFTAILHQFEGRFSRIRVVYTRSAPGDPVPLNDMIDEVNGLTGRGATLEAAVASTFFARQAARHGFTILYVEDPDGARAGHYDTVIAEFRKPHGT